jgi:site-specific DNA recombinase
MTSSKTVILARVSSRTQDEVGYSLDSQLKLLRDYCANNQLRVVKEFRIVETASKQQIRKEFQELLAYIYKGGVQHLVVEKTDRLTRNYRDAANIDDWLEGNEQRILHIVKENLQLYKGARSTAKFMWGFMVTWAKQYTDNLREEAMKGWAEKLAQGWLPSRPPAGYMTVTENGKKIHIPNPDTMQSIQRIFELYLLPDQSLTTIRAEAGRLGLVTRRGRPFSRSQIAKMLNNPFYIGTNRLNGKEYPGAQEPLIDKKLFNAVQRKLHKHGPARLRKHNPVFKGMILCAHCGKTITWQLQKGRYYGYCQRTALECRGRRWLRQDRLEARVVGLLSDMADPRQKLLKKLKEVIDMGRHPYVGLHREGMIESLNRQLNRLDKMKETLYEDKLSGLVSKEQYSVKVELLDKQAAVIQERLMKLYQIQEAQKPVSGARESLADLYTQSSPSEKRIVMGHLFKDMYFKDGEVILELR